MTECVTCRISAVLLSCQNQALSVVPVAIISCCISELMYSICLTVCTQLLPGGGKVFWENVATACSWSSSSVHSSSGNQWKHCIITVAAASFHHSCFSLLRSMLFQWQSVKWLGQKRSLTPKMLNILIWMRISVIFRHFVSAAFWQAATA